jgi:DNA topoisomerase-1
MKLIVVESPTKARTIANYLPNVRVMATMGHIKDLPKSELGIDVDNGFTPDYHIIKGKGKIVKEIVNASKKTEGVYIATDPDREGEAIAYHLQQELPVSAKRVLFYEMTKGGIKKGLSEPGDINENKVLSQRTRRTLDRLVGYKISPLLWKIVKRNLSAGRVQSVVLRLILEREKKIEEFVPEDYWVFNAIFKHENGEFKATLWKINEKTAKIKDEKQANEIEKDLLNPTFMIGEFTRKDMKKSPPPPLITSSLQREASNYLNFSTKKTMFTAQRLFEGVKLPGGQTGLITYMRTDSVRIANEALKKIREFIKEKYGDKYLPKSPNRFKSGKTAQEAHEAIRPTDITRTPESVKEYLNKDEFKLYQLIWKRALASQFECAVFDSRVAVVKGNGYQFKASSKNLKSQGFYKILNLPVEEKEIPLMEVGDRVRLKNLENEAKRTTPPPRYSEATIVKEMEKQGIGRPSTYSPTISTLFEREYIKKEKGFLIPLEMGKVVNKVLISYFDSIINCKFTSNMEATLDKIEKGEKDWQESLSEFYQPFIQNIEAVESNIPDIKKKLFEVSDSKCPKCGRPLIIKWGRFGKFLSCSGYPQDCDWRGPHPDSVLDEKCPKCGANLIIRIGRYGRFKSCPKYPDCKYTAPISTGVACPLCGKGEYIERKSKKGKIYYPCSNEDCDNILWDKPVGVECPKCGAPFMVEKKGRQGDYLYCLQCKHKVQGK